MTYIRSLIHCLVEGEVLEDLDPSHKHVEPRQVSEGFHLPKNDKLPFTRDEGKKRKVDIFRVFL